MLSAQIAGVDLRSLGMGGHGPITVEYGRHGSELAEWEMAPGRSHPLVRGNALVEVYDGGFCVWCGTLNEPGTDGAYAARGLWHQAEKIYPMDGSGNLTTTLDTAIYNAIVTRAELKWVFPDSISAVAWSADVSPEMTLADLLDRHCAENGLNWYVDSLRAIRATVLPTTPQWVVPNAVAGRGLTPAEDTFYTHLDGRYKDAGGAYHTVTVGSAEAELVFGRRSLLVDLTDLGNTTVTRAQTVLQGMLLKSGARMGWGEGLDLGYGQIVTPGGTPATLSQVSSLQMVRLAGTVDTSRPFLMDGNTDVVLETVKYTDGSRRLSATPFGYAPRSMEDVWNEVLAGA